MDFIDIFKALGDETRIRIINLLLKEDMCVSEIETILEITQSNASRHLNRLKIANVIDYNKKSQWIYYRISDEFKNGNKNLYEYIKKQVSENDRCINDNKKLNKYKNNNCTCKMIRKNKDKVLKIINSECKCENKE